MRTNKSFTNEEIKEWAQEIWFNIVQNGDQDSKTIISATVSAITYSNIASAKDVGMVAGRLLKALYIARASYWKAQREHEAFLSRWD